MLDGLEREKSASASVHYHRGLQDYHEFVIRMPMTGLQLIRLTGRGYLPEEIPAQQDAQGDSLYDLARHMSMEMRKALALDPDLKEASTAELAIAIGDFFHTGRTDPALLDHLDRVVAESLSSEWKHSYNWMRLALYTLLGRNAELEGLATEISASNGTLTQNQVSLILSHGYFVSKNYLKALQLVRQIKTVSTDAGEKSEALRMEGEIFLIQNGPFLAIPYFQQALAVEPEDVFLKERLASLQPQKPESSRKN
jgi:hypothetical protein